MIIPDVNLLVYAANSAAPQHQRARVWWEALLTDEQPVGLPWAVALGYVRVVTHPRVLSRPASPLEAVDDVQSWLERPSVQILEPGPRHLRVLRELLQAAGVAAALTSDAHLAALAIEHQALLCSNDHDFARFPGLRWSNPLK